MNPDEIRTQILHGQAHHDWTVFQPPKYPPIALIFYGISFIIVCPLICTAAFGLIFWLFGQSALVQSSFWSMYTTYPFLALVTLGLPFFLTWLVWRLEKRDRDTLLVLLPDGFIQYTPWSKENKSHVTMIEYQKVQEVTCRKRLAGMVLNIQYKNKDCKKVFITWKYGGTSPRTTVHEEIVQQIMSCQHACSDQASV